MRGGLGDRHSYRDQKFKDEAVALLLEQGYSVPEAAKSLGMLYNWKELNEHQAAGEVLAEDEREEKRLRKENKELRMEKEILKKASAFFAKEMKFAFIQTESANYPVRVLCRVMQVGKSGLYARKVRPPP